MYIIDNKKYDENPALRVGGGSEGWVSIHSGDPTQCVKLFHEPDPSDPGSIALDKYRSKKVVAVTALVPGLHLPDRFKLPLKPAYRDTKTVGGLLMGRVPAGYVKIMELLKMQYRVDNDITLQKICLLFADIFDDIRLVHSKGLIIRDVNTGCVLVNHDMDRQYVDCDSWSYPGYPSLATTELFCHPDLYADLSGGGGLVEALPKHDRFSFTVMLVLMALHGAHPFRMGIHSQYTSLQERAINGVTILDDDVNYPAMLPPRETLSDDLLHKINTILKRQADDLLDTGDLRNFANELSTCPSCGLQFHHSRNTCPKCQAPSVHQIIKKVIRELFKTDGSVLFAQVVGDSIRVACRVYGELQIAIIDLQSQKVIHTGIRAIKGARYRFFGEYIVICQDPYAEAPVPLEIYKIEDSGITNMLDSSTGALENSSALVETSADFLFRTAGNTLLCGRFFGKAFVEEPVTTVHRNQTWFTVDRQSGSSNAVVFGYDRALRDIQWFLSVGNSDGEHFVTRTLDLPLRPSEKQSDFAVYFNKSSVLLVRKTTYHGVEHVHYSVIPHEVSVSITTRTLAEGDAGFDYWKEIEGKLYQASSVIHVGSDGLIKQNLANDTYSQVPETQAVIFGDRLLRFGSSLAIVRAKQISVYTSK